VEVTGAVNEPPAGRQEAGHLLDADALPCGAEVDPMLEQVAGGRAEDLDAHQRDCVHCQAAVAEFAALWAPVAETAARPVAVPPGLTAAVMSQIRTLIRDVWYTLQTNDDGVIRIAARIVAALARDTARMVPGVRVALGRSTHSKLAALAEQATFLHRHPHAAVGVLGRTAAVDLAVAVSYGDSVHEVAREIQQNVIATLRDSIGLKTVAVNVIVDDVLIDDDQLAVAAGRYPQVWRCAHLGQRALGSWERRGNNRRDRAGHQTVRARFLRFGTERSRTCSSRSALGAPSLSSRLRSRSALTSAPSRMATLVIQSQTSRAMAAPSVP
jgi:uncharacterized alkaline shock family protein YloU